MPSKLRWKWLAITAIVAACVFGITGLPRSAKELAANWDKSVRLGLDLEGGSHIVLQVQVQDAFKAEADAAIEELREAFRKQNVTYNSMDRNDPDSIETAENIQVNIKGVPVSQANDFRRVTNDHVGRQWLLVSENSTDYRLNLRKEASAKLRQDTLTQSIRIMERKVNGLGVAEAAVQRRGGTGSEAEIMVQLPGVDDPARVKAILQTAALLELCEVKEGPVATREAILSKHGGVLPLNTKIVRGSPRAGGSAESWWLLARSPVITGRDLRDARAQQGEFPDRWETGFSLTQEAAGRFERFTSTNLGNRLAIVLDNTVISAPTIQAAISDQGQITGASSVEEASDLALNLRAGSLPAGVRTIEERSVGPSLGADSVRRGITSGLVGLLLVVGSMLLYYRGAGLNAVLALFLNTIITVVALSYIDATWTLPGIAGLVLSIGMAVDSNVLIFERIKEEMRAGKTIVAAIEAGFDRALVTIIDTHVTTVVASAFLFVFGTGPVRGFAVTLVVGLIANLFTAVFVSRAIFDVQMWRKKRPDHLSIGHELFRQTTIDFLSKRNLTLGLSALAIVISIASLTEKDGPRLGLDFRGGTLMYVKIEPKPPIDELRQALSSKLPGEISVQETQGTGEFIIGTELADEARLEQARQALQEALRAKYANLGSKLDLNNATHAALEDRLRMAGVHLDDEQLKLAVGRILDYRDREKSGLLTSLDELGKLSLEPGVLAAIQQECGLGTFNLRSVEIVGPRAGEELRHRALLATLCALGGMLAYIAFRFQWIAGTAAVIATAHDVIITVGLFSLTNREINLNIIAALLTLIGYSMNDKIVVFDRVRENLKGTGARVSYMELVNRSINQTLSRTLLTAGPTLLACLALYFLGGEVLNGIAFALFVGIIVGTYSSIFVASALLVMWHQYHEDHKLGARRAPSPLAVKSH